AIRAAASGMAAVLAAGRAGPAVVASARQEAPGATRLPVTRLVVMPRCAAMLERDHAAHAAVGVPPVRALMSQRGAGPGRARRGPLGQPLHEVRRGDRGRRGAQRGARTVQELAYGAAGHAERDSDLLVRAALELAQHDRVALAVREVLDGADHGADVLLLLH